MPSQTVRTRPPSPADRLYRVELIGTLSTSELQNAENTIAAHPRLQIVSRRDTLPGSESDANADFLIVLQACSDQYGSRAVNRLIESNLGRRIVCCYGAFCVSDGRSIPVWPTALRVPFAELSEFLEREIALADAGVSPLPPTASGDELFARRWHLAGTPTQTAGCEPPPAEHPAPSDHAGLQR